MKRLILACLLTLCGCAIQPQTPIEQLAVVEASLTGAYRTIADLTVSKAITPAEHDRLFAAAEKVEKQLDTAKDVVAKGIPKDALEAVRLLNTALLSLQAELKKDTP